MEAQKTGNHYHQASETNNVLKPSKVLILMLSISVLAAAAWVAAQGTPTQTPAPSLIDNLMKSTKLKYVEQKDFYKVRYTMGETPRKHDVYVRMVTHEYRTLKVNEVFGLVWESDKAATHDQLITIFQKKYKMGGLIYELPSETQKNYRIRYAISLPLNSTPEIAKSYLNMVATTGDQLENDLNPGKEDEF